MNKDEVLKLTDEFYISFYCKDDICVSTNYDYSETFIELPDKNGNKIKYIVDTCNQNNLQECNTFCTTDSQCLSNKCFKNKCIFNNETPVVHCDDIYNSVRSSYALW